MWLLFKPFSILFAVKIMTLKFYRALFVSVGVEYGIKAHILGEGHPGRTRLLSLLRPCIIHR